jgi:hypothetical protein
MKRIILFLIISSISFVLVSSCKKGEDDPSISLRSRDSRFAGNWKVKLIDYVGSFSNASGKITYSIVLNGSTLNYAQTENGVENQTTLTNYNMNIDIKKNNDYTFVHTYLLNGESHSRSYSRKWHWLNSNKTLVFMSIDCGSFRSFDRWHLRELKNKELVLIMDASSDFKNTSITEKETISLRLEFEKIK